MNNSFVTLEHYLVFSSIIFFLAILGLFLFPRNLLKVIMSIELMLVAININFVAFSCYLENIIGQIFSIIVLTIAAAEVAFGFALLIVLYRTINSVELQDITNLRN